MAAAAVVGSAAWSTRGTLRSALRTHVYPAAGLERGQCTWYVYQRAQASGWRPRFTTAWGRHARAWWTRVANARRSPEPAPHAIMVLDGWPGNPYGHVAFVEEVHSAQEWTVTHANLRLGEPDGTLDGVTVLRAECRRVPEGVRLGAGGPILPLIGFLLPER